MIQAKIANNNANVTTVLNAIILPVNANALLDTLVQSAMIAARVTRMVSTARNNVNVCKLILSDFIPFHLINVQQNHIL